MNRFLYTVLLYLALPFVPLKLCWRGIKQPSYLAHWAERFGFYQHLVTKPIICVHCVSVGETRAAAPLILALQARYPQHQILITHTTPTGRDTSAALFGDRVLITYLPYDIPFCVARFLKYFKPAMVLLMETELWFNLIHACHQNHTPILLINARLSEKSAKGYAKLGAFVQTGLNELSAICAQTNQDALRFEALGVTKPIISGNLKFDVSVPHDALSLGANFKSLMGGKRRVFVGASTRDGEEALILDALLANSNTNFLTVIVPRHPQRFSAVEAMIKARGINYAKRSQLTSPLSTDIQVLLGDSMGELLSYYAASDLAFIGGSLLPFGGQNLIEACTVGTPVLIGQHTYNFEQITEEGIQAGAVLRVQDATQLMQQINLLIEPQTSEAKQKRSEMQKACLNFVALKIGATQQTMQVIDRYIN
jgi:3-deoxy-D-manno-octulosonic-acid transferase